jgi:hypothetical protein
LQKNHMRSWEGDTVGNNVIWNNLVIHWTCGSPEIRSRKCYLCQLCYFFLIFLDLLFYFRFYINLLYALDSELSPNKDRVFCIYI